MSNARPVLSVTIPTKNSAATLGRCLEALSSQTIPVELVIADDCSTDGTEAIARAFGAQVLPGPLPLLEARYKAFCHSTADVVLFLDSDQILQNGAIQKILEHSRSHDMLILGESSASPDSWLSRLYEADKRLVFSLYDHHRDPQGGSLLPRVFQRWVLTGAFEAIPARVRHVAVAQDHAIIYQASARFARSTGFVPDVLLHVEMARLGDLWRKYFHWGQGLAELLDLAPEYRELTTAAVKHRLHRGTAPGKDFARSMALMALKAPPYSAGYALGWARLLKRRFRPPNLERADDIETR
jgi:glycosyltransferase involved in cell wall biosynthesis